MGRDYRVLTVLNCQQKSMGNTSAEIISRILLLLGWTPPIMVNDRWIKSLTKDIESSNITQKFRDMAGIDKVDQVYYCHNLVGSIADLALNAYPEAERIMIGDGLGQVYDRRYLSLIPGAGFSPISYLQTILAKLHISINLTAALQNFSPDKAVLILPMDYSGDLLSKISLEVIPRDAVISYINDIRVGLPELSGYTGDLIRKIKGKGHILILTNFSDGGFIELDAEAEMFEQMVRTNIASGETIIIKAHPLSEARLDAELNRRLKNDYNVITFSRDFDRYPFELCKDLIEKCEVITISSVAISLKYLYGKNIVYGWDEGIIKRFFPQKYWRFIIESDAIYRKQLEALKTWDGKSVLCKMRPSG